MPAEPPRQPRQPLGFASHPPRPQPASSPREFAQPHHREEPTAPEPDAELVQALSEVAKQTERRQEPATTSEAVLDRTNATLDLVTAHVLKQINTLREELDAMEKLILSDTSRLKAELESHVSMADRASAQTDKMKDLMNDLRAERARHVNARTIQGQQ